MPEITKRKVTMTNWTVSVDADGKPVTIAHGATDYVRPDFLDVYVADAQSKWQSVVVSDEPDAGPAGYHGETYVPEHLDHPLAGKTFAATNEDSE